VSQNDEYQKRANSSNKWEVIISS